MTVLPPVRIDDRPQGDDRAQPGDREAGLGTLSTPRGNLPLHRVDAAVRITGLVGRVELTQGFHNPHDVPLEATYIFPLPARSAVTAMTLTAADRTVRAELRERGQARRDYNAAIAAGQRAAIAEQERPDVFTMRVGNILPGERVTVALSLVGPLSFEDGEATFRLPLVVAPRYIPGTPTGGAVGSGYAADTDAVPDASRITPPVLLPGFPNPVALSIGVDVDPAGLPLTDVRSSLHAVVTEGSHLRIEPGERLDRDFILRLSYGEPDAATRALVLRPDDDGDEGTFRLTVLPPTTAAPPRPRDVVLVLDRSGSMSGWKMVCARRAASRIVDTLTSADRFAVIAFDDRVEEFELSRADGDPGHAHAAPRAEQSPGLHPATDRNRYAAVEFLSRMDARGGTELLAPLQRALDLLTPTHQPVHRAAQEPVHQAAKDEQAAPDAGRDRVIVLVTDGQVGNEDQILSALTSALAGVRVHTVGIDRAVNAGFLGRLAAVGGGRSELVESEDRLDDAMAHIHRRIGAPVVRGLSLAAEGFEIVPGTVSPARLPDLFPGAPLEITGRYRGAAAAPAVAITGRTRTGEQWSARAPGSIAGDTSITAIWARTHLHDLEDQFAGAPYGGRDRELEQRIVATSLRFGVLCRFTAWVAIDERVVTEGGEPHRVVQPVELPSGWELPRPDLIGPPMSLAGAAMPMAVAPGAPVPRPAGLQAVPPPAPMLAADAGEKAAPGGSLGRAATGRGRAQRPATAGAGQPGRLAAVAAQEARRLRAAASLPDWERRELLADLGTRLQALVVDLGGTPEAESVRALWADLAEDRIAGLSPDEFGQLWDRVLSLLDSLATA